MKAVVSGGRMQFSLKRIAWTPFKTAFIDLHFGSYVSSSLSDILGYSQEGFVEDVDCYRVQCLSRTSEGIFL